MTFNPSKFGKIFQQFAGADDAMLLRVAKMLRDQMMDAEIHPSEIRFSHESASSPPPSDEVKRLHAALEAEIQNFNRAQETIRSLKDQIEKLKSENDSRGKLAAATRKINKLTADNEHLQSVIVDYKATIDKFSDRAAKTSESELAGNLKGLVDEYATLVEAAKNATNETDTLRDRIRELTEDRRLIQAAYEQASKQLDSRNKTIHYMRKYLSERVAELCINNGETYADEEELVGAPSWARR